ncbi:hypothetical protein DFH11DRAFT_1603912 [Phellopilus nigrolimitatus]|nr:hypothetical protein DFH11DRAFT_1603912 [Phellopilus nigrolimitatus]
MLIRSSHVVLTQVFLGQSTAAIVSRCLGLLACSWRKIANGLGGSQSSDFILLPRRCSGFMNRTAEQMESRKTTADAAQWSHLLLRECVHHPSQPVRCPIYQKTKPRSLFLR